MIQVEYTIIVQQLLYADLRPIAVQYSRTDSLGDIYAGIP